MSPNGKLLGVAFAKLDLGIAPSSFCDHSRRKVDPDNRCTASCGSRGDVTGSGRDIDYPCARLDAGSVEEWLYALYGELAESLVILPRNTLPTAVLKLAKRVGINHVRISQRRAHCHSSASGNTNLSVSRFRLATHHRGQQE